MKNQRELWRVRGKGIAAAWKGPVQPPNAASSAIVKLNEDGSVEFAVENTKKMYQITHARHRYFTIPYLGMVGTPTGIDIRKAVATGITPTINTGIAHREPNRGQIGAGLVTIPLEPFKKALRRYAEAYGI